jgi:hypothetical protein
MLWFENYYERYIKSQSFSLGFGRYGHTDTDMVIPIYSKLKPMFPSKLIPIIGIPIIGLEVSIGMVSA